MNIKLAKFNLRFVRNVGFAKDEFLRQSTMMFLATMIGSACSYFYQIYVGRALGPEGYGVFGSLFAIFYLVSVFAGTIQAGGARFISRFNADEETENIGAFISSLIKRAVLLGALGFAIFYMISPGIASFLKMDSNFEVVVLGTVILVSLLVPTTSGALQGLQKFDSLAMVNILIFGFKLLFGVLLVNLGFGVSGALGAITMATVVAFLFSLHPLRSYLRGRRNGRDYDFKELYLYSLPAILVMLCLAVPSNFDVILAKHFFADYEAGLYTSASVLGKVVLFVSGAVSIVMFPKASGMSALGLDSRRLLNKSLIFAGLLSGSAAAIFLVSPELVGAIFGAVYLEATPIIKIYAVMMFLFSLTWVLAQYCLATNKLRFAYILASFTLAEMGLIFFIHDSTLQMVKLLAVGNLVLFLFSYAYAALRRDIYLLR